MLEVLQVNIHAKTGRATLGCRNYTVACRTLQCATKDLRDVLLSGIASKTEPTRPRLTRARLGFAG